MKITDCKIRDFFLASKNCTRKYPSAPCNDKGGKKSLYCAVLAGRTQANNKPDKVFSFLPLIHHSRAPSFPSLFYGGKASAVVGFKNGEEWGRYALSDNSTVGRVLFYPSSTASGPPSPRGKAREIIVAAPSPKGEGKRRGTGMR